MNCQYCKGKCRKAGRQKNGVQRLYCAICKKHQQTNYQKQAYMPGINREICNLLREGVGIRGIGRILKIAVGTVLRRIKAIASRIDKPVVAEQDKSYEVDELWTFIGRKSNEYWIAYVLERRTRQIVDFIVGKRTKSTLRILIEGLLDRKPAVIRTDKLAHYHRIIPKNLHRAGAYCINRIERKNLTIRTHLKRLSRRTIGFSRDVVMLESCLRICFWQ